MKPDCPVGYYQVYDEAAEKWLTWPIPALSAAGGRLALLQAGLLEQTNAIVEAADEATRLWYEYAQEWERGHPAVIALGAALGLTEAQIDALFFAAE